MFDTVEELLRALGDSVGEAERAQVLTLASLGLPPVTSKGVLSAMLGVNPGLVWSFLNRPARHYRSFQIPKGNAFRAIDAPKVALKILQKWLSVQLQKVYVAPDHVFGFVPGRSHVQAAQMHVNAEWVFSVDVRDFFQTTPQALVHSTLQDMGFTGESGALISQVACLRDALAQGAPTSPVLSNMCFAGVDRLLLNLATKYEVRLTRYADDIVLSGAGVFPEALRADVIRIFEGGPWRLAENKTELASLPRRLKVHGLLVHGASVRLTKGYRNKLRAYRHLLERQRVRPEHVRTIKGHVAYSDSVDRAVLRNA